MYSNVNKEITFRYAEENDVDLLLDMKLDIILNNKNVLTMNKAELEKAVLEAEEQIRENLIDYKVILKDERKIGFICISDSEKTISIDYMYIMQEYRNNGIGTFVLKEIIKTNYKPICILIDKDNIKLINMCEELGFFIEEKLENKIHMRCENDKEENEQIKAEILCKEVSKLCEKYKMKYFFYTEDRSISNIDDKNFSKQIEQIIEKNI